MRIARSLFLVAAVALPLAAWGGGGKDYDFGKGGGKAAPPPGAVPGAPPRGGGVASPNAVRGASGDELAFGAPIKYQNITIVPVGTNKQGPFQRYTLLEEGIAKKTLAVREMQGNAGQAQVNSVEIRNTGGDPVYLLGGEMILGGKQDRIIERDTVVPPNQKWTPVSVFCVEQGRWHGQNMEFAAGGALVQPSLQQAALSGDQSQVWAEVARKNLQHGTQSASGTYRRTIQNAALRAKIAPYREQLVKALPADLQTAGVVFAINGDIRVADLFGNPVLFSSLRDKLLSAYILEALGQQTRTDARAVSAADAKTFLLEARKAKKVESKGASGRAINYKRETTKMIGSETVDATTGQGLRETYLSK